MEVVQGCCVEAYCVDVLTLCVSVAFVDVFEYLGSVQVV